jgi:hypothetical protein
MYDWFIGVYEWGALSSSVRLGLFLLRYLQLRSIKNASTHGGREGVRSVMQRAVYSALSISSQLYPSSLLISCAASVRKIP